MYNPEVEEDDGYSIPKILVAVLLLVLIGAGIYIYYQQRKLETSVTYLIDSKKQVEQDLNAMIEKYNLAIDNNGDLENNLKKQRDKIIRFRDSISKIKVKDKEEIKTYKEQVSKLKNEGSISFESSKPEVTVSQPDINKTSNTELSVSDTVDNTQKTAVSEEKKDNNSKDSQEKTTSEKTTTEDDKNTVPNEAAKIEMLSLVETPPTFPGCKGSAREKKDCFSKNIKKFLYKKFDAGVIDNIDLNSGKKRINVSFIVDRFGRVTHVRARAPHEDLEKEAIRVVKKLPKMLAAKQNGKPIGVSFSVPITVVVP